MKSRGAFVAFAALAATLASCDGPNARTTVRTPAAPIPDSAIARPSDAATASDARDLAAIDPRLGAIDASIEAAIAEAKLPGCVVVIGRSDAVLWKKAYGARAILPQRLPMTLDTVFDIASLTKPVATASSIMVLAERGQVGLDDPVAKYVPEFSRNGKGAITVRQLLTHTAGLPADTLMGDYAQGRDEAMRRIMAITPKQAPGVQFNYSDVGFLLLEEIVRRVSGQDLAAFSKSAIFTPLGMLETGYLPTESLQKRAAPTELRDGEWIQGTVHDPRAHLLGGVAGHAGVFSTADDMTKFAQAMLRRGTDGAASSGIFAPKTMAQLTSPHDVPGGIRALGWDVLSRFSTSRGDVFSRRAIGHGGYTGTALWIDPDQDLFVLFLSNRVHPDGKGSVNPLAGKIASIAGRLVGDLACETVPTVSNDVKTGIDVLRAEDFRTLKGAHVGLITNASGRAKDGARTIEVLQNARDVKLVALFAPEHGLGSDREGLLDGGVEEKSGLPLYSLYGETFAPTAAMLEGIDTLVFDIQDVGTRFYTYASTMRRAMAVAAENDLRFVVLDRPNPIDGVDVSGPILSTASHNFVNHHPLPVRHGMTIGELAELFDADEHMGVRLHVVRMQGYRRASYYDQTALPWVSPSPNLRNVGEELLYPGVGLLEGSNVSVGRGTTTPFEVIGAPWIDGAALSTALGAMQLAGVSFEPASFEPTASVYRGQKCGGIRVKITDRAVIEPVRTGVAIAMQLHKLYPQAWHMDQLNRLLASRPALAAIDANKSLADVEATWTPDLRLFQAKREKYLLYPLPTCALAP